VSSDPSAKKINIYPERIVPPNLFRETSKGKSIFNNPLGSPNKSRGKMNESLAGRFCPSPDIFSPKSSSKVSYNYLQI
jgi:hypothetical protein